VYGALAGALVAAVPVPLAGRRVLDLGAGTGFAGRAALAAGAARVVAVDAAVGMLRRARPPLQPVAGDAAALPFACGSFGLVLAAFCLNHLDDLTGGLREARRVGGAIAASVFAPGWTHPARDAVDEAVRALGYVEPAWYASLIRCHETEVGDPAALAGHAEAAGFPHVAVRTVTVATGVSDPAGLAAWRLGMANYAPFLRTLDAPAKAALRQAAERAVAGTGPLVVDMTVLTAG
jgi:SAM-dependent methyltransferase